MWELSTDGYITQTNRTSLIAILKETIALIIVDRGIIVVIFLIACATVIFLIKVGLQGLNFRNSLVQMRLMESFFSIRTDVDRNWA